MSVVCSLDRIRKISPDYEAVFGYVQYLVVQVSQFAIHSLVATYNIHFLSVIIADEPSDEVLVRKVSDLNRCYPASIL